MKSRGLAVRARHFTPFPEQVKPVAPIPDQVQSNGSGQSTEAVDKSVHNVRETHPILDSMGLTDNLSIFSPTQKTHIFH